MVFVQSFRRDQTSSWKANFHCPGRLRNALGIIYFANTLDMSVDQCVCPIFLCSPHVHHVHAGASAALGEPIMAGAMGSVATGDRCPTVAG